MAVGFRCTAAHERRKARLGEAAAGKVGFKGTLHKTRHSCGRIRSAPSPAPSVPDGKIGIFESNSIMRAVARLGENRFPALWPRPYMRPRASIAFSDASLVFARDAQNYLLSLMSETVSSEFIRGARRLRGLRRRHQPGAIDRP